MTDTMDGKPLDPSYFLKERKTELARLFWRTAVTPIRKSKPYYVVDRIDDERKNYSPVRIEANWLLDYPVECSVVMDAASQYVSHLDFNRVVGVATSGIWIARDIQRNLSRKGGFVRRERRPYDDAPLVEGPRTESMLDGEPVLLVDSAIFQGRHAVNDVRNLRERGATVKDFFVLFDWERRGAEMLEREGIKLHSLLTAGELFTMDFVAGSGNSDGFMDLSTEYTPVTEYLRDRESWHEKRGLKFHSIEEA
jgi:orotate phosphoribosyltransferase